MVMPGCSPDPGVDGTETVTSAEGAVIVMCTTLLVNFEVGSYTVKLRVPMAARLALGTVAVSAVALWTVVATTVPFTSATDVEVKPVHVIAIGSGLIVSGVVFGETEAIAMGE